MLKLKLQYFGHLMQRADSLEKTLMLEKIEGERRRGDRGWDGWVASPTQWTWVWASSRRWRTGKPCGRQSMLSLRVGHNWMTEQQQQLGPATLDTVNCSADLNCLGTFTAMPWESPYYTEIFWFSTCVSFILVFPSKVKCRLSCFCMQGPHNLTS